MELTPLREVVHKCLISVPETRDNDNLLITQIWWKHLGKSKLDTMSAWDLMELKEKGGLPNEISIVRARRLIQQKHIELRGENYEGKQKEADKIKDQIRKF